METKDSIDYSFEYFNKIFSQLKKDLLESESEYDIRMKLIDPIFQKILNWYTGNIHTEEYSGNGFLDYKFSTNGLSRLIVEAKKDTVSFGLENRTSSKTYQLNGSVLSQKPYPKNGILQAISYCSQKNAELACLTNGNEWIIFRGSRLGDGRDTLEGKAFLFTSLEGIKDNFKTFYDLLSYQSVYKYYYRAMFQEAEGQPIRSKPFTKTLRHIESFNVN